VEEAVISSATRFTSVTVLPYEILASVQK